VNVAVGFLIARGRYPSIFKSLSYSSLDWREKLQRKGRKSRKFKPNQREQKEERRSVPKRIKDYSGNRRPGRRRAKHIVDKSRPSRCSDLGSNDPMLGSLPQEK